MAPQFKLYYFDGRGRAEIIRLIFHLAGVEYEDIRFTQTQWEKDFKKVAPFGQAPLLEVIENGQTTLLCQTHAIARYLSRMFGLNGNSPLEEVQVEMTADCVEDYCMVQCSRVRREQDPKRKQYFKNLYLNTQLPEGLMCLEKHLKQNKGGDEWFVGSQMNWCDIVFYHWMEWIPAGLPGVAMPLDDYPKLKALYERVAAHPKIAEWREMRPATKE